MNVTLRELLNDEDFIAKLYGWSYNHCFDKVNTEELCQEIILQLLIASQTVKCDYTYAYIWKIAENTYNRIMRLKYKHNNNISYDSYMNIHTEIYLEDDIITSITDNDYLQFIKSQIAFMSKIYRDVMVMFYFDGLQMNEIADKLQIPVNRVKQRLFSAKEKIKKEVNVMSDNNFALKPYKLGLPGAGNPLKSNVRDQLNSIIAQNIVIACKDKAKTPSEIAVELSIPTVYIEDMLDMIVGEAIKDCGDGKYIANTIIIDDSDVAKINETIKTIVKDYVKDIIEGLYSKKDEIMNWDYLNPPKSFEFILWSLIPQFDNGIGWKLAQDLNQNYDIAIEKRDFKVVGIAYRDELNGFNMYGNNGIMDDKLGLHLCNFIGNRLPWSKTRFSCSHDMPLYTIIPFKCIGGLRKEDIAGDEKEAFAQALDINYIFLADDGKYYPNIIIWDKEYPFYNLPNVGDKYVDMLKDKFIEFIDKYVPPHLLNQRDIFINIMTAPLRSHIIEEAIEQGALYIPHGDAIVEGIYGIRK